MSEGINFSDDLGRLGLFLLAQSHTHRLAKRRSLMERSKKRC